VRELDYIREVGSNPLLAYIMLQVIDKFQQTPCVAPEILAQFKIKAFRSDKPSYVLTPSRFYRILFLIQKDCERKTIELRLPYYWYKSGPVVYGPDAPHVFEVTRIGKTQQVIASYGRWKDTILAFDECESAFSDAIVLTLEAGGLAQRTRLDVIYEYTPSQLHRTLVATLNQLSNAGKKDLITEADIDKLANTLVHLSAAASDERYDELRYSFEEAADKSLTALTSESDISDAQHLVREMWNVLSLGLRAKENANINQKQIRSWERTYNEALLTFERQLISI
jgi:hypothetical protein